MEAKLEFIGENWGIWMDIGKNKLGYCWNLEEIRNKIKINMELGLHQCDLSPTLN